MRSCCPVQRGSTRAPRLALIARRDRTITNEYSLRFGHPDFCSGDGLFGDQDKFAHHALRLLDPRKHFPVEIGIPGSGRVAGRAPPAEANYFKALEIDPNVLLRLCPTP